jgi:hypothetical protein
MLRMTGVSRRLHQTLLLVILSLLVWGFCLLHRLIFCRTTNMKPKDQALKIIRCPVAGTALRENNFTFASGLAAV